MTGGLGDDINISQRGDGQDVISERGGFLFGPLKAVINFLPGVLSRRRAAAANDNDIWRGAALRFAQKEMVA